MALKSGFDFLSLIVTLCCFDDLVLRQSAAAQLSDIPTKKNKRITSSRDIPTLLSNCRFEQSVVRKAIHIPTNLYLFTLLVLLRVKGKEQGKRAEALLRKDSWVFSATNEAAHAS